jgi:hypothetical protein
VAVDLIRQPIPQVCEKGCASSSTSVYFLAKRHLMTKRNYNAVFFNAVLREIDCAWEFSSDRQYFQVASAQGDQLIEQSIAWIANTFTLMSTAGTRFLGDEGSLQMKA